jgi:adenylate kinase
MMLVEFFGMPGSGKSTISHLVARSFKLDGYLVNECTYHLDHCVRSPARQLVKSLGIARYAFNHPGNALAGTLSIKSTGQASTRDFIKSLTSWMYAASLLSRRGRSPAIDILDQGIAQAVWSIGFAAQRDQWMDAILDGEILITAPIDIVIHVTADVDVIADRLSKRTMQQSRAEAFTRQRDILRRGAQHCANIVERLAAAGVTVIEANNDGDVQPEIAARAVVQSIAAHFQTLPGRDETCVSVDAPWLAAPKVFSPQKRKRHSPRHQTEVQP